MALIQCPECNGKVSTAAPACPHCGAPFNSPPSLPTQERGSEETIHHDDHVTVTTTRVIVRGTTYALRNITSVRMTVTDPKNGCALTFLISGVVALLILLSMYVEGMPASRMFWLYSAAGIAGGIFWMRSQKKTYHVAIASSSGEANALSSTDREYIEHIVGCVNDAIIKYQ